MNSLQTALLVTCLATGVIAYLLCRRWLVTFVAIVGSGVLFISVVIAVFALAG